jgi:hypothetical protein
MTYAMTLLVGIATLSKDYLEKFIQEQYPGNEYLKVLDILQSKAG